MPVITGNNRDEYRYLVANDFTLPVTKAQYDSAFTTGFGPTLAPSMEGQYPRL